MSAWLVVIAGSVVALCFYLPSALPAFLLPPFPTTVKSPNPIAAQHEHSRGCPGACVLKHGQS